MRFEKFSEIKGQDYIITEQIWNLFSSLGDDTYQTVGLSKNILFHLEWCSWNKFAYHSFDWSFTHHGINQLLKEDKSQ
jgi:hypothetical protein